MSSSSLPALQAILFYMDGVLSSVGSSYRESIVQTAARFGLLLLKMILPGKRKLVTQTTTGFFPRSLLTISWPQVCDFNWYYFYCIDYFAFTHIAYLEDKSPSLEQVTEVFEEIYQGTDRGGSVSRGAQSAHAENAVSRFGVRPCDVGRG